MKIDQKKNKNKEENKMKLKSIIFKPDTLVIIDGEPKYEISQIVDSKINCQWAYKLLYKMIWLGYKNTEDKSEWISISELTHAANLVSDFYITYPAKPSPLPLF